MTMIKSDADERVEKNTKQNEQRLESSNRPMLKIKMMMVETISMRLNKPSLLSLLFLSRGEEKERGLVVVVAVETAWRKSMFEIAFLKL